MNIKNITTLVIFTLFCFNFTNAQWVKLSYTPQSGLESIALNGSKIYVGTQSGLFISSDYGTTWAEAENGLPTFRQDVPAIICEGSTVYIAYVYMGLFISTDAGLTWTLKNNGLPNSPYVEGLVKVGNDFYMATDEGVFHSNDEGANWTAANNGLTDLDIRSIAIIGNNLFAGTYNAGLFKSAINPISWISSNDGLPLNENARCYAEIADKIFLGNGDGVFVSSNGGLNWTSVSTGIENMIINDLLAVGNTLFAAIGSNDGGIVQSTDFGLTWNTINDGLPAYPYTDVLVMDNTNIFAGGPDNGSVWSRPLSELVTDIKNENEEILFEYKLSQNYPNPFNPTTKISFTIPKMENIKVKLYNLLGEEIAEILNETLFAGSYSIDFDGSNLSTGVYFYSLESNSVYLNKKMILIK
ncbi:MAG: T9SS type A sorting domain-containing protein [bacterium]